MSQEPLAGEDDAALLRRYRNGSDAAFAEIFARYGRKIYGFFCRRLADPGLAEDLMQQTFLRLHRARAEIRGDRGLQAWLFTVAFNLCRDERRRAWRRPRTTDLAAARGLAAAAPDYGEIDLWRRRAEIVRQAVQALPPGQREAVLLCKYDGMSAAEAGRLLGIAEGAVRVRVFRALQALRQQLEDAGLLARGSGDRRPAAGAAR